MKRGFLFFQNSELYFKKKKTKYNLFYFFLNNKKIFKNIKLYQQTFLSQNKQINFKLFFGKNCTNNRGLNIYI